MRRVFETSEEVLRLPPKQTFHISRSMLEIRADQNELGAITHTVARRGANGVMSCLFSLSLRSALSPSFMNVTACDISLFTF
jgi:chorismate synthase